MPQISGLPEHLLLRSARARVRTAAGYTLQQLVEVASPPLTRDIGVIRWGRQTDRLGGTGEHVADRIREALQFVSREPDPIMNDVIVCGTGRPL